MNSFPNRRVSSDKSPLAHPNVTKENTARSQVSERTNANSMLNHRARIDNRKVPNSHPLADNRARHDNTSLAQLLRESEGMAGEERHVLLVPVLLVDLAADAVVPDSDKVLPPFPAGLVAGKTENAQGAELVNDFLAALSVAPGPEHNQIRHIVPESP